VLARDPGSGKAYDLGLFTLDTSADAAVIAKRYSWWWPIEPSNAAGKQLLGAGDARNRVQKAVERTVPFAFLIQSLLTCWYVRWGWATTPPTSPGAGCCARGPHQDRAVTGRHAGRSAPRAPQVPIFRHPPRPRLSHNS
jgi:hypothetical protein